jgi:hypothetical protein
MVVAVLVGLEMAPMEVPMVVLEAMIMLMV